MTAQEAIAWAGNLVKIAPQARTVGHARHFMRARLIAVDRDYGIVHPAGHRGYERIRLEHLRRWRAPSLAGTRPQ